MKGAKVTHAKIATSLETARQAHAPLISLLTLCE
jgi:hypothetical protein